MICITEEFVTPLSTPPSEMEDAVAAAAADTSKNGDLLENNITGISESAIHSKIYET